MRLPSGYLQGHLRRDPGKSSKIIIHCLIHSHGGRPEERYRRMLAMAPYSPLRRPLLSLQRTDNLTIQSNQPMGMGGTDSSRYSPIYARLRVFINKVLHAR